jgi:hypothetical protein
MPTIINGTSNAITFPDSSVQNTSAIVSGYIPYANLPAGSVLQVVYGSHSGSLGSTNSTPTDTGLTATITPRFATSKVLVITYQCGSGRNAAADALFAQLLRGGTTIAQQNRFSLTDTNSVSQFGDLVFSVLDSPATTSATTYKVQANRNGSSGVGYVNVDNNLTTITLMEIAA